MQKDVVCEIWPYLGKKMGFELPKLSSFLLDKLNIRKEIMYKCTSKEEFLGVPTSQMFFNFYLMLFLRKTEDTSHQNVKYYCCGK